MDKERTMVLFPSCLFCEAIRQAQTFTQLLLQILPQTTQGLKRSRLVDHPLHPTRTDINNELIPVISLNVFTSWHVTTIRLIKNP
jgi:hypothetical protein